MGLPIVKRERCRSQYAAVFTQALSALARLRLLISARFGRGGTVRGQEPSRGQPSSRAQALGGPLAIALLLPAPQAAALGVGELRTQSALNQSFYGEIDLLDVDESNLDQVEARLASPSAFKEVGLERPAFLTEMRFTPMIGPGGGPMIQVISHEPIREPYLALLLEFLWPDGRLVKEYAVLLDPPAVDGQGQAEEGVEESAARSIVVVKRDVVEHDFPLRYGPVPSGVGLTEVGRRLAMPGVTLEQIALALYRSSPGAFVGGNINRLRQGAELIIPTRAELLALDPEAAREQYWAATAGARIAQAPLTDVDARLTGASQETTGHTGARDARTEQPQIAAEGAAPTREVGAKKLAPTPESVSVLPTPTPSSVAALEAELLLMREQNEASRQAAMELRTRVQELEAQLSDMRRLLDLRHAQRLEPKAPEPVAQSKWQSANAAADTGPQPTEQASDVDPLRMLAAWRNTMPGWELILLAVTLFLALLGLVLRRRRAQEQSAVVLDPSVTPEGLDAAAQTERQALRLDSDWSVAGAGSATPAVARGAPNDLDSLAEADVYLTYGRHRDAERVLREAVATTGSRPELRYKLAETYLAAGDEVALAALAEQMRAAGDPTFDAERWARVVSALEADDTDLSLALDPLERMTDADDALIAMPVVEVDALAIEDAPEARWSLEKDERGR